MAAEVSDITVPVYGREMHAINGEKTYQPYGPSEKYCNYSVSRTQLNIALMNAAEKAGAKLYFNRSVASVDLADSASTERGNAKTSPRVTVNVTHSIDTSSDKSHTSSPSEMVSLTQTFTAPHIIGADGAGSKCRRAMKAVLGSSMQDDSVPLNSAYKELQMPAARDGSYIINKDALHIWPRGSHFLMALPDLDGTFTVTLYLKGKSTHSGDLLSFEALNTPERVLGYFKQVGALQHKETNKKAFSTDERGIVVSLCWDCLVMLSPHYRVVKPSFIHQGLSYRLIWHASFSTLFFCRSIWFVSVSVFPHTIQYSTRLTLDYCLINVPFNTHSDLAVLPRHIALDSGPDQGLFR